VKLWHNSSQNKKPSLKRNGGKLFMTKLYIGLMSGTCADGIDAVLIDLNQSPPALLATHYQAFSSIMQKKIIALCEKGDDEIERLGELDILLGKSFADAANQLLKDNAMAPNEIVAIGCHGQTIRHHPRKKPCPYTLQIGDPNTIATLTGITTISDFRRKDIALGGEGAPLVPAFHQHLFATENIARAIVNIGGMANVTFLPKQNLGPIIGFDTGPGNVLLDAWIYQHQQKQRDEDGAWGRSGSLIDDLLASLKGDPYFHLSPPKSTGREYFNLAWLNKYLVAILRDLTPVDVQRTLVELTATTILSAIRNDMSEGEILICGGGTHNLFLMERLCDLARPHFIVNSTAVYGMHPDWIEASAFAWLAKQTLDGLPGNLPSVTGASSHGILGGIYPGELKSSP
jgi:anhydro-N-acetylmuramic acid kinase